MKNIFYCYRYKSEGRKKRYTPEFVLEEAFPEWEGLYTMNDTLIETNTIMGCRMGWIEVDDSIVDSALDYVVTKGLAAAMEFTNNSKAIAYMDTYTDYTKVLTETDAEYTIREADVETSSEAVVLKISLTDHTVPAPEVNYPGLAYGLLEVTAASSQQPISDSGCESTSADFTVDDGNNKVICNFNGKVTIKVYNVYGPVGNGTNIGTNVSLNGTSLQPQMRCAYDNDETDMLNWIIPDEHCTEVSVDDYITFHTKGFGTDGEGKFFITRVQ